VIVLCKEALLASRPVRLQARLAAHRLEELPPSVRSGTRLSTMTSSQAHFPILPAIKPFKQYGASGMWLSELIPHIGSIADDICLSDQ